MKNFVNKIKTFVVSHKVVSIASASVVALAIVAGTTVGVMINKNNKIDINTSSFEATGSFEKKDNNSNSSEKVSVPEISAPDATVSADASSAVSEVAQTESKASEPTYTQTPAGTAQSNKGTATTTSNKNTQTTSKSPAASTPSQTTPSQTTPTAPTTPTQPSGSTGGSTGGSNLSSDIAAGTQMGQAIASGIDTSDINLPKDEQGRFICPRCGKPMGDGYNGTCIGSIAGFDSNWNEILVCNHYS